MRWLVAICQHKNYYEPYIRTMNKFAERLSKVLQENQISQRDLAKKINMSQSIVNNYCTGKREPKLDVLMLICKALHETADYLLGLADV